MTQARRHDVWALAILTSLITVLFIDVLIGYHSLYLRDVAQYYYPMKHVLREIVRGGEFPWWNPFTSAGQPLAANPEHEVFYPLTWLILLPSYDLGFRLLVLIHLYIAAWTMYALLRSMRVGPAAAFLTALSFALSGIVLSSIALLPILFVLAWLPLTCLFTRRFLLHGRRRDFALAALSFGVQLLVGEPTTIVQTGLILGAYALHLGFRARSVRTAATAVARVGLVSIAALALAAVLFVPAIDHARASVRGRGFELNVVTLWSMPVERVAELAFPNFFGHHELDGEQVYWGASRYRDRNTPFYLGIYSGLLIAVMAVAGMVARRRGAILTATLFLFSVLVAIGHATPLWRLLYDTGLVRSIRFPEKFILTGVFALLVFAGRALGDLLDGDERIRRAAMRTTIVIVGIAAAAALATLLPGAAVLFAKTFRPNATHFAEMFALFRTGWIVAVLRAGLLALLVRNVAPLRRQVVLALVTLFVLLDLGLLVPEITPRVPAEYFSEPPAAAQQLAAQRSQWRLMHLAQWQNRNPEFRRFTSGPDLYWLRRNALAPMVPARWDIRTVLEIDYDLTSLAATEDFVRAAWRVAEKRDDWPALVGAMSNVWFVATYTDPQAAFARARDGRSVQPIDIIALPQNPRYFFARHLQPIRDAHEFSDRLAREPLDGDTTFVFGPAFQPAAGTVRRVVETSSTAAIDVETSGRSFLVMSVTPHKFWTITIDDREVHPVVTNVGYQGVVIPSAGRHVVRMRYRNPLVVVGAVISLIALAAVGVLLLTGRRTA